MKNENNAEENINNFIISEKVENIFIAYLEYDDTASISSGIE